MDSVGANKIYEKKIPANFVAIVPPDFDSLRSRLMKRNTENLDVIEKRINIGKKELEVIKNSKHFNLIIENTDNLNLSYLLFKDGVKNLYSEVLKQ